MKNPVILIILAISVGVFLLFGSALSQEGNVTVKGKQPKGNVTVKGKQPKGRVTIEVKQPPEASVSSPEEPEELVSSPEEPEELVLSPEEPEELVSSPEALVLSPEELVSSPEASISSRIEPAKIQPGTTEEMDLILSDPLPLFLG